MKTEYKATIRVKTDGDFKLVFPPIIKGSYNINHKNGYSYKIKMKLGSEDELIRFLEGISIDSSKEWHKEDLKQGVQDHKKQLILGGLGSNYQDLLGGGNWSFSVEVIKVTKEYL